MSVLTTRSKNEKDSKRLSSSLSTGITAPGIDKVGPSKFIGYRGMTGLKYMEDANSLDGRETQGVLRKLFVRLGEGTPEYRCVRQKVVDLSHKYGKSPNETATFSAPREWRVSMGKGICNNY